MIFKIVTFNILNTSSKPDLTASQLVKKEIWTHNAHVYGLQEVNYSNYDQLPELAVNQPGSPLYLKGLSEGRLQVLRGRKQVLDESPYGQDMFHNDGVAMLFSVPAVTKEYFEILHLSAVNVGQRARFTLPGGKRVWVYNVHLHYMRKNDEIRFYQLIDLMKWINKNPNKQENEPEFITGDFNMQPCEVGYELLEEEGFLSVMKSIHGKDLPTYPSGLKGQYVPITPNFILDYVWYRGGSVHPVKAKIIAEKALPSNPDTYASDHKGIYAEFLISEMKPKL